MRRLSAITTVILYVCLSLQLVADEQGIVPKQQKAPPPGFVALEKAVAFIAACLDNNDFDSLVQACIGSNGKKPQLPKQVHAPSVNLSLYICRSEM